MKWPSSIYYFNFSIMQESQSNSLWKNSEKIDKSLLFETIKFDEGNETHQLYVMSVLNTYITTCSKSFSPENALLFFLELFKNGRKPVNVNFLRSISKKGLNENK